MLKMIFVYDCNCYNIYYIFKMTCVAKSPDGTPTIFKIMKFYRPRSEFMKYVLYGNCLLLKKFMNDRIDVNEQDFKGRTALMVAASMGNMEMCDMLYWVFGADISLIDMYGFSGNDYGDYSGNMETMWWFECISP